ncbi:MAG: flavin reductase family protein [Solirubrobacterales bacterium]|nr:flavin reductase family protein [Solirubrobacterales bacterium]MCO5326772.1 flavin reductase family protein [Solirubrobacterales bacterium]
MVIPRPIAWVSTTSAEGVDNLAPHSFFTVSCIDPPIVQFTSVGRKDSLSNVEATGEFVVCMAPEPLFERINATGTDFSPDEDEFALVGLEREPSLRVKPPRVAASPVAIECRVRDTIPLGDSTVVLGSVVHLAIDEVVITDGLPDARRLDPLARLGRDEWSTLGEIRSIPRIRRREWPGHFDAG